MQAGRMLDDRHAGGDRRAVSSGRCSPSAARNRYALLSALREFPHAHSVYPFGDELHYTDDAPTTSPRRDRRASSRDYLARAGIRRRSTSSRSTPAIEDSFMALMGAAPAATAA